MAGCHSCPNFVSFKLLDKAYLVEKQYICTQTYFYE